MPKLALWGGPKTISAPFEGYNSIGKEELEAAQAVLETGVLSKYLASWSPDFYGGEQVQALENEWSKYFNVAHAVVVNSNTSGLIAALGAIGIEPGDEVIVSPWTMSASATSILVWNAIPVFADIEDETFNLDPASIIRNITHYTRAIMLPDIFGHAADLDAIMEIASKHGLRVIEDNAQSPAALYKNRYVGTVADIGVFSLNYHKHIHTGEGGVCVTNDPTLAERIQLIRNHAESAVEKKGVTNLSNMIGFNFRLTEMQAAIGREQLKKLAGLVKERQKAAERLTAGIRDLPGLRPPVIHPNCTHVYYVYPLVYDPAVSGVPKAKILAALQAEGVTAISGTYANVHLFPIFQQRIAYGMKGFPWSAEFYKGKVSYEKGTCPMAELLQDEKYMGIEMCKYRYEDKDIDLLIAAFRKVWEHMSALKRAV
jgi:perosamine synthetase